MMELTGVSQQNTGSVSINQPARSAYHGASQPIPAAPVSQSRARSD
jgi:hypothetical protein